MLTTIALEEKALFAKKFLLYLRFTATAYRRPQSLSQMHVPGEKSILEYILGAGYIFLAF